VISSGERQAHPERIAEFEEVEHAGHAPKIFRKEDEGHQLA
jgi:hypothetical protein